MGVMALLERIEQTLGSLLEGGFGRIFRTPVKPMEIARRLAREMDAHRTTSLSRTYAPNEFLVWLSQEDRQQFAGVEDELIAELCAYLLEHARREGLTLRARPAVGFETDPQLRLGEFAIQARLVSPEEDRRSIQTRRQSEATVQPQPSPAPPAPMPSPAATQPPPVQLPLGTPPGAPPANAAAVPGPAAPPQSSQPTAAEPQVPLTPQPPPPPPPAGPRAALLIAGRRIEIGPQPVVVGRSRACDIVIDDPGVSRRHAEIRPSGDGFEVRDLGSTNGVYLNRAPIERAAPLRNGDLLELGATEIRFEET